MKELLEFQPQNNDLDLVRITRLRTYMQHRTASLCSERALLVTESFETTEGEDYLLRKAKAFAHTLKHMTIYIEKDSLIFGNQAARNFAAPLFPEYSIQWIMDELDEFEKRPGDVFHVSEKVKRDIQSIAPYWMGKTHEDEVNRKLTTDIRLAEKQGVLHRGGISMSGDGHIVADHEMILKRGFRSLIDEANEKLKQADLSVESQTFYQGVVISLEGALHFIKRYAALAIELSLIENDTKRQRELILMGKTAQTLMEHPAASFYEGLETIYLVHLLQSIESNGHSVCYGRFDQYMNELYTKDSEKGLLSQEKALELITHFFLMNNSHNKVRPFTHTQYAQGYPLYSNLMIGGRKSEGTDGSNELSTLCIEAMNLTAMAEPNFSMRYNNDTPRDLLKLAAKLIRTGCGMPALFNDDVAVKGLTGLGIPLRDALDYCSFGCVETGIPGKYGHRATGMTYVNWGKVIELVVNNGTDPNSKIQMISLNGKTGSEIEYNTYDDVWQGWEKLLRFYSDIAVACDAICDRSLAIFDADPFASCFIDNCMKLGKTLKNGGSEYDVISQSNIGPIVVGNSLAVIKKLIFEDKKFTFLQLKEAMELNWQGPMASAIHKWIRHVPKFGNDEDETDEIVIDVFESYLKLLPMYKTERTGKGPEISCYTMSTSNITSYVPNGLSVGATPDGRFAHSPLNEGCSPMQGTDTCGPTAVLNSVAKLPNSKVAAGQLLNMRFAPGSLKGENNLDKFVSLLQAAQDMGIYHNQFNVIDSETLMDAKLHPQHHTDLIVRVAGYCAQFVSLMPEAQDAIIARTENKW